MVDVTTYSEARQNLASLMDRVIRDNEPIIVARRKRGSVVVVSLAEWNSVQETLHLLSTRANARSLLNAIDQAEQRAFAKETSIDELRGLVAGKPRKRARSKSLRKTVKRRRKRPQKIPREAAE